MALRIYPRTQWTILTFGGKNITMKGTTMLMEQTMEKLHSMKLNGMAQALKSQSQDPNMADLSFEDRLGFIVDEQWLWKENRSLSRRINQAGFKCNASFEDLDYRATRALKKTAIAPLSQTKWIEDAQNCILTGPTGVGKTYLACAIGQKACRNGFKVMYYYTPKLFREIEVATVEGNLPNLLKKIMKTDLLIIDDWGMEKLKESQLRDLLEILEDRHGGKSTLMTSQFPIDTWHDGIGNPTLADAILDRLIHNAFKIQIKGDSMRKFKQKSKKSNLDD